MNFMVITFRSFVSQLVSLFGFLCLCLAKRLMAFWMEACHMMLRVEFRVLKTKNAESLGNRMLDSSSSGVMSTVLSDLG